MTISVALAVRNEEGNLARCLASVKEFASEIVVVDGGSTDMTVSIARDFGAKIKETDNPPIFHINKQKALDMCTGDWILQLDTDEVVSQDLTSELQNIASDPAAKAGYYLPRRNYFLGHWMRKGGQYPDYVIRFFRRGKGSFPAKSVHEQITIDGDIGHVKAPLDHYSYRTLGEYWRKARTYIDLTAREMQSRNEATGVLPIFTYTVVKPMSTFLVLFLRHKGFVDHVYGFLFALFSALHHPLAYRAYLRMRDR